MLAVPWRQQAATPGADVSFPEGLSQYRGWSDRDLYFFFNKYDNFCRLFPEGSCRAAAITAESIPWDGHGLAKLLRDGFLGVK